MSELDLSLEKEENEIEKVFADDKKEESILPVEKPKKRIKKNTKVDTCEICEKLVDLISKLQDSVDIILTKIDCNSEITPGEYFGNVPNVVNEPVVNNETSSVQTVNNNDFILPPIMID